MWRIKNQLGDRTIIPADTAFHHFQNSNLTEGLTGHYNYLANMGSPRMSRIFFDRRDVYKRQVQSGVLLPSMI